MTPSQLIEALEARARIYDLAIEGCPPDEEHAALLREAAQALRETEARLARIREAAGPAVAALEWALDLLDMYDGKLVELGEPAERVNNPIHTQGKANARADLRALARELEASQ